MSHEDRKKGKYLVCLTACLGLSVLLVGGFAFKRAIVEQWYLWELHSREREDREAAAATLGAMRSTRAIVRLTELLRTEPIEEPHLPYSAEALTKIGAPAVSALSELLKDRNLRNRRAVIWTIGAIGRDAGASVPYVVKSLEDEDWVVRQTAAEVLGLIGPAAERAVPALTRVLEDENEYVRNFAAAAIRKIQGEAIPDSS